jgi:hypothetical protein
VLHCSWCSYSLYCCGIKCTLLLWLFSFMVSPGGSFYSAILPRSFSTITYYIFYEYLEKKTLKFPNKEIIRRGNANSPDMIIIYCMHILNYHTETH